MSNCLIYEWFRVIYVSMKEIKRTIRCAIYTRKSSEDGLEQDFNSLDAQREACEAYIKSQQHEGWVLIEKCYDDGGFSGGTLERPAVKELFKDIEAGEVDIVVVYKVDRLTRSLMDFSKIVELFDKQNASFVSITQHFNTTTSMGRLTLNILLSFAQFEREVTGERIRDKIAASKKKGMWMGGNVPIGYKVENKTLIPDSPWDETVQKIFDKYLELKSVTKLKADLEENNISGKSGINFSKGNLYYILSNIIYTGKVKHKKNIYEGEHQAIIDKAAFEKAQEIMYKNRVDKSCGEKSASNSLLVGKIFDDKGNRMTPSHSNAHKRRYRYYVSLAVTKLKKGKEGSISKIPAGEVEKFVTEAIKEFLKDTEKIQKYITQFDLKKQKSILNAIKNIKDFSGPKFIRAILSKVIISKNTLEITICENALIKMLQNLMDKTDLLEEAPLETDIPIKILKKVEITKTSQSGNILIISSGDKPTPLPNPYLINAIVKSHYWHNLLIEGKVKSVNEIQELEGLADNTYIKDVLKLKFISPNLTEQILNGIQPKDLSVQKLLNSAKNYYL